MSHPRLIDLLEQILDRAARLLDVAGYLKPRSCASTLVKLRRVLFDQELTKNDVKILGGLLAQLEWKTSKSESI